MWQIKKKKSDFSPHCDSKKNGGIAYKYTGMHMSSQKLRFHPLLSTGGAS